ncbi:brca1-associated protein [Moniliophthora roreri]|nr:brca1-associated protein [Moniliophthora roreri]
MTEEGQRYTELKAGGSRRVVRVGILKTGVKNCYWTIKFI